MPQERNSRHFSRSPQVIPESEKSEEFAKNMSVSTMPVEKNFVPGTHVTRKQRLDYK
eukprot:TRINITY_DN14799_c0_g1_i1.p3 TRINITY_DN14799_c0_g1~~TRINITY_DN14799_c0_g1_i1.p3  ORF type:complete len:57 (+),score=8.39 TRINITY_DN14799_c0_g1_i1:607-777(+)